MLLFITFAQGFGDYVALSYSRSVGNWTPDDEEWNWIFGWDGKQVSQCYLSRKKNWEKVKLTQGRFTS